MLYFVITIQHISLDASLFSSNITTHLVQDYILQRRFQEKQLMSDFSVAAGVKFESVMFYCIWHTNILSTSAFVFLLRIHQLNSKIHVKCISWPSVDLFLNHIWSFIYGIIFLPPFFSVWIYSYCICFIQLSCSILLFFSMAQKKMRQYGIFSLSLISFLGSNKMIISDFFQPLENKNQNLCYLSLSFTMHQSQPFCFYDEYYWWQYINNS